MFKQITDGRNTLVPGVSNEAYMEKLCNWLDHGEQRATGGKSIHGAVMNGTLLLNLGAGKLHRILLSCCIEYIGNLIVEPGLLKEVTTNCLWVSTSNYMPALLSVF